MQIIGPDLLVFGMDDVPAAREFLTAYRLEPQDYSPEKGGRSCRSTAPGWKYGGGTIHRCRPR